MSSSKSKKPTPIENPKLAEEIKKSQEGLRQWNNLLSRCLFSRPPKQAFRLIDELRSIQPNEKNRAPFFDALSRKLSQKPREILDKNSAKKSAPH